MWVCVRRGVEGEGGGGPGGRNLNRPVLGHPFPPFYVLVLFAVAVCVCVWCCCCCFGFVVVCLCVRVWFCCCFQISDLIRRHNSAKLVDRIEMLVPCHSCASVKYERQNTFCNLVH